MGQTPRDRLTQLPLPTRSTEASSDCFGRVVLSYLREDEQKDASFFILGDILHRTIEKMILNDGDLDDALLLIGDEVATVLGMRTGERNEIESSSRGFDTMLDDADRMIKNWFTSVHPDSEKRHPIYDEYQWPPRVEQTFYRTARSAGTKYPVWGSVDALFQRPMVPKSPIKLGLADNLIVDWKSGTQKQKSDFQLNFYRFGMNIPNARAAFHHLDRVRKNAIIQEAEDYPGDKEIRQSVFLTEQRKDAVLRGKLPQFAPDWYCQWCPVQHVCPVDGDPRNRADNKKALQALVKKVEPMLAIEGVDGGT